MKKITDELAKVSSRRGGRMRRSASARSARDDSLTGFPGPA